jgi:hypothetical protein
VLPESEENLCNAIPALVETTAPGALLDNAAQLLGYATASVLKQTYNSSDGHELCSQNVLSYRFCHVFDFS